MYIYWQRDGNNYWTGYVKARGSTGSAHEYDIEKQNRLEVGTTFSLENKGRGLGHFRSLAAAKSAAAKHLKESGATAQDQTIKISLDGKRGPVRVVARNDGTYAAGVVYYGRNKRRVDIIGVGSTREAALYDMLAKRAAYISNEISTWTQGRR